MRSLYLCVWTLVTSAAGARLRCVHPRCEVANVDDDGDERDFMIEGNDISIIFKDSGPVYVDCKDWWVLESPAMPSFTSLVRATSVELSSCPPPASGSFAAALAALNVTLLQDDGSFGNLSLSNVPLESPLAAQHFAGLERIEHLDISPEIDDSPLTPIAGFLSGLKSLRSLELSNMLLPIGELDDPPSELRSLTLADTNLKRLPETLLALSHLQYLEVMYETTGITAIFELPPPALDTLTLHSTNTTLQLVELPAVEEMSLLKWTERRPTALTRCDKLLLLKLFDAAAEALPERWVAACPRLDVLRLESMRKLVLLPSKLLEGASSLTSLSLTKGVLETLPEGLLDGVPNLTDLSLADNRLHTIASDAFLGSRALDYLNLDNNRLERSSLAAVAPLKQLSVLSLSDNTHLGDLCVHNGYSPLLNLTRLISLYLSGTNITRICRDWRENMTLLSVLELKETKITELKYADFQYKRNATVSGAQVRLDGAPVTSVRFTERDYKRSLTAPATAAWVRITSKLECDCRMYWTGLVAENYKPSPFLPPLYFFCTDNRNLKDVIADNTCAPTVDPAPNKGTSAAILPNSTWFLHLFTFLDGYLILFLIALLKT